ncbi:MAG: maleylpyruvate isomerase N-terminal domain-containing protein [Acidobacteriota bacterium]|nr:maleylpyruvate isomerase N-terminal domain-containing protein [Acidobacteriota bacterium]
MPLAPPAPIDTRAFFRPVSSQLAALLRRFSSDDWAKPAVGSWQVRDVVAHMVDTAMRRVSFQRDGHPPPPPPFPIEGPADFVRFINRINADWVEASRRLSGRQLTALYDASSTELADFMEAFPEDGPGLFGVSWAGEMESAGWFDIGREFTEQWHHQVQVREAVGAPPMTEPAWQRAVLGIAMRGLPHAFRDHHTVSGTALTLDVTGVAGGAWTLERVDGAWRLLEGTHTSPATRVTMTGDAAWRLLFNALPPDAAASAVRIDGDTTLAGPLLAARSIVV